MGALVALLAFVFYILTLCPTVDFIDAGELAAVVTTLGIAHPTGYPLFTLIGRVFEPIPLGFRTIEKLNLLPAVECSLALFLFFLFLVFFLDEFRLERQSHSNGRLSTGRLSEKQFIHVFVPALCGTLVLAFSETFWSQAISIEVYSLHTVFISGLLLVFTRAIAADVRFTGRTEISDSRLHRSLWLGFAYLLGCAFTNHMTTILLAPGFLYLYFAVNGFSRSAWKRLLYLAVPFLLGLSLYLYLPLRAIQKPIMNWGNPVDIDRFFWHFSGKQYRVWLFSSTDAAMKQLQYYWDSVLPEFGYAPLALAVIGAWKLFRESRSSFVFTILLFLGCVLYSINYDIHDIDSYFLLSYYAIAVWIAAGVAAILKNLKKQSAVRGVAAGLVLVCVVPLVYNYERVDGSKNVVVEEYTRNMFASLEPNAIVMSYQWDYFVSSAYYFQLVEHVRPDVVVIDKELMRRSWYYVQLEARYPWLVRQSRKEVDDFLRELYKFEHDLPYDPQVIEHRYAALIESLVDKNFKARPVYVTSEIEQQYLANYRRVPSGLAFRLVQDDSLHDFPVPEMKIHVPARRDKYVQAVIGFYAQAYTNNALCLYMSGNPDASIVLLEKALEIYPGYREALALKTRILAGK